MAIPATVKKFGDLQIPARCPSCAATHKFFYLWLRHSGGYCCPACDRIVAVDLVELDMAVMRLDTAIRSVRDVVNRVACRRPATRSAATPPGPVDIQI
jgi:hypothetical protein